MAVEIPVYVDIQGAFDRAVAEIPAEAKKLNKVLSANALKMQIDLGGGNMKSVQNLLTDTTMSTKELEHALKMVKRAYDDAIMNGANKTRTSAKINNLAKAYGLLSQRIKGYYDSNEVAALRLQDTIAKITFRIGELKSRLSTLAAGSDQYNKLNYELKIQEQRLREVTKQQILYKSGVDAANKSVLQQSSLIRQLSGYFTGLYAATTVLRFVKQVRDVTGELEYQRIALGHLLNDMEFGNELFEKTIEAAKESPFRITQLVTYTKQLAAYRIEQEELFDTTQRLADISAGLGVSMDRLILAYGQVRAASVLRGQELRQFTEAGIPLVEMLADKFTKLNGEMVTTGDVFKLISERAVPFQYIKEIFEELTDAGGMFYKMQEEQAKTLKGRWEKLKDAYDQALNSLGSNDTFQSWNDTVLNILNAVAKNLAGIVRLINAATVGWIAYRVATSNAAKATAGFTAAGVKATVSMIKMYGVTGTLRAGVVALGNAWKRLMIAFKANWVGIVISAVATAITYFSTFRKKADEATEALTSMERAIENMKDANKQFAYEQSLIEGYKELASTVERTATQNEHLATVMEELRRLYPDLSSKIGDENTKLEEQIPLLEKAAEEKRKLAVEEAKEEIKNQKQVIRGLEEEAAARKQAFDKANREREIAEKKEKELVGTYVRENGEYAEQLKQNTIEAAKNAKQASKDYEEAAKNLADARNELEKLEELVNPKKTDRGLQAWADEILELENKMNKLSGRTKKVFEESDLKEFSSVYDLSKKLNTKIKDLTTSLAGMRSEYNNMSKEKKEGTAGIALDKDIKDAEELYKMAEAIRVMLGLSFGKESSYTQDPFIKQMENRIKFMKDFQKGYEDLSKYLTGDTALDKELEYMRKRGLSLGIEPGDQVKAARGLSSWYQEMLDKTFAYLQQHKGVKGTMNEFLSRQITGSTNNDKMLRDFQALMQSLFDAKTDFDVSQKKKDIEKALRDLANQIKQSEQAKNFYNDILGLTGDQSLAANMTMEIYGTVGDDFKKQIQKELSGTFAALTPDEADKVSDVLKKSIEDGDIKTLMAHINELPEKMADAVRRAAEATEKYNVDIYRNFANLVSKYGDTTQKIATIRAKAENEIAKVREALVNSLANDGLAEWQIDEFLSDSFDEDFFDALPDVVKEMIKRARSIIKSLKGQRDLDIFKESEDYITFFADINMMTAEQASMVRGELRDSYLKAFKDGAISADELRRNLRAVDEQYKKLNEDTSIFMAYMRGGFEGAEKRFSDYADTLSVIAAKMKSGEAPTATEQGWLNNMISQFGKSFGGDSMANFSSYSEMFESMGGNMEQMGEAFGAMASNMSAAASEFGGAIAIVDAIVNAVNDLITSVQSVIDELNRVRSEDKKLGDWYRYIGDFNKYAYQGWNDLKSGNGFAVLADIVNSIISIFSNIQISKVKKLDKEIKTQSDLIEDLEYEYSRLEVAIKDAFGSEYISNYNKQLEVLKAQAEAYRAQAENERKKGKSADEDKAKEYDKKAQEYEDKITDSKNQLAEFFSGTDVTSAAKDFAQAWIDAYKEFGSTTDAMKEKFNEMIENMVVNSLAAQLVQGILKPIFDQIDDAAKDGALTAEEMASISAQVPGAIEQINSGMTGLMSELTSAGVNLRQQAGSFTGISRDIANASEESINGLAAGINTQNFYISHIDQNVAMILSVLTGGATTEQASVTGQVADQYKDEMLKYAAYIPNMDQNLADLLAEVKKVIKPKGVAAQHYISTNL